MGLRVYADIEIRGVVYPTAVDAARALGVTDGTVRAAARNGTLHRVGLGQCFPEPMPIRIRGVVYPDAHTAARANGVTVSAIWQAMHKNKLDRVGLGPSYDRPSRAKPFAIGPARYVSMAAASVALGFSRDFISRELRRNRARAMERIIAAQMARDAGGRGAGVGGAQCRSREA